MFSSALYDCEKKNNNTKLPGLAIYYIFLGQVYLQQLEAGCSILNSNVKVAK